MFEYLIVWLPTIGEERHHNQLALNEAGEAGWELVSAVADGPVHIVYLKRPKALAPRYPKAR